MNMKTKFIKVAFIAAITVVCGVNVCNVEQTEALSDVALANVEALASDEGGGLDCNYLRDEGTCTIYVGIGGSIELFNMKIIHADSQGYITIDGKVNCSKGGSSTCRQIECYDLYKLL